MLDLTPVWERKSRNIDSLGCATTDSQDKVNGIISGRVEQHFDSLEWNKQYANKHYRKNYKLVKQKLFEQLGIKGSLRYDNHGWRVHFNEVDDTQKGFSKYLDIVSDEIIYDERDQCFYVQNWQKIRREDFSLSLAYTYCV